MADIIIKTDSTGRKAGLICLAILVCLLFAFFVKWSLAQTIAFRAEMPEDAELAVALAGNDPEIRYAYATELDKTFVASDMQKAVGEYETAVALSPSNYLFWLGLGRARERNGDRPGAEAAFKQAVEFAPNYSDVQWAYGNTLLRNGDFDNAFDNIRKAVAGDAKYAAAAVISAWDATDGNIQQIKGFVGDSTRLKAELAVLLVTKKEYDEGAKIWEQIPADELAELKTTNETLLKYLIEAKQFRLAKQVARISATEIVNGGFEEPLRQQTTTIFNWKIADGDSPRIGQNDTQKHSGNYSLLLSFGNDNRAFRTVEQAFAVTPGDAYTLNFFHRAEIKTSGHIQFQIVSPIEGRIIAAGGLLGSDASWRQATVNFDAPNDCDGVVIRLTRMECATVDCAVSGNLWIDDISVSGRQK